MDSDEKRADAAEPYDPPRVDPIPSEDGPSVTAAGDSPVTPGPEWRPADPPADD